MYRFLLALIILLALTTTVNARPTEKDDEDSAELFLTEANHQEEYKLAHGVYQQESDKMRKKFVVEVHEYVSPLGDGFIVKVKKIIKGKVFVKEQHFGPETDRHILENWTCINCNDEDEDV